MDYIYGKLNSFVNKVFYISQNEFYTFDIMNRIELHVIYITLLWKSIESCNELVLNSLLKSFHNAYDIMNSIFSSFS